MPGGFVFEVDVEPEKLAQMLVVMAKSDGVTILHAEEEGYGPKRHYEVYYECDPDVREILKVRCENAGLEGYVIWGDKEY